MVKLVTAEPFSDLRFSDLGGLSVQDYFAGQSSLVSAVNKQAALEDLWDKGLPPGYKTGWPSVDALYTVVPGQLSIVTGWPNSGKSEWVDALLVNLSRQGWHLAYFSPENMPVEIHQAKLLEKIDGRPFGAGPSARIPRESLPSLVDKMEPFRFLEPSEGSQSAQDVCKAVSPWLMSWDGPRGLVIDPWNELEHHRPPGLSETEYVSQTLSWVRQWARTNKVHVWIVAHPQKVKRDDVGKLPVPKPDMISGSQHWWNKADCCVTVYREMSEPTQDVEIYVQKVRFKHVGRIGKATLRYERVVGRYTDPSSSRGYEERNGR